MTAAWVIPFGWYGLFVVALVGTLGHIHYGIIETRRLRESRKLVPNAVLIPYVFRLRSLGEWARAVVKFNLVLLCLVRLFSTLDPGEVITSADLFGHVEVAINLAVLSWWSWREHQIEIEADRPWDGTERRQRPRRQEDLA